MTKEQVRDALQRNCYHINIARILHGGTLIWSELWQCLDCPTVFEVKTVSDQAPAPGIDEVFDEVLKQWVRH